MTILHYLKTGSRLRLPVLVIDGSCCRMIISEIFIEELTDSIKRDDVYVAIQIGMVWVSPENSSGKSEQTYSAYRYRSVFYVGYRADSIRRGGSKRIRGQSRHADTAAHIDEALGQMPEAVVLGLVQSHVEIGGVAAVCAVQLLLEPSD